MTGDDFAEDIAATQKSNRQAALRDKFASHYNHLMYSADAESAAAFLPGWDGQRTEAWRCDIAMRYWFDMTTKKGSAGFSGLVSTMQDWIGSRIDMRTATADPVDFWALLSEEAESVEVRRDWTRVATAYTQTTMKVGQGNARDEQHSAYLVDADLFLSSDRRLVAAYNEVRRQASFPMAQSRVTDLQRGRVSAVEAIRAAVAVTAE